MGFFKSDLCYKIEGRDCFLFCTLKICLRKLSIVYSKYHHIVPLDLFLPIIAFFKQKQVEIV